MTNETLALVEPLRLTVDYDQSLEVMIAAGHYDWSDSKISAARYPIQGSGTQQVEVKLFQFDRLSSEDAVAAIKAADAENPWEPGKIEHLLSFGATYPDEQRGDPIVAPGSIPRVYGGRRVPYLGRGGAGRSLGLSWWDYGWFDHYRFLAVRPLCSGS